MENKPKQFTVERANEIRRVNLELRKKRKELKKLEGENPDIATKTDDQGPSQRGYHLFQEMSALRAEITVLEKELKNLTD